LYVCRITDPVAGLSMFLARAPGVASLLAFAAALAFDFFDFFVA
jgi:hypothetical protein